MFPISHRTVTISRNATHPPYRRSGSFLRGLFSASVVALFSAFGAVPTAVAQDLYVVNNSSSSILKIAPDGTQTTFASGLNTA